jgi:hypothetical protein
MTAHKPFGILVGGMGGGAESWGTDRAVDDMAR